MQAINKALATSQENEQQVARNFSQKKASHNILNDFNE